MKSHIFLRWHLQSIFLKKVFTLAPIIQLCMIFFYYSYQWFGFDAKLVIFQRHTVSNLHFLFKNSNSGKAGKIVNLIFINPIWQMILNICQFGRQNSNLSKIKVLNTNYVFATVWKKGYVFRIVDNSFFFCHFGILWLYNEHIMAHSYKLRALLKVLILLRL